MRLSKQSFFKRQKGYVLVDVTVALIIFAFAVTTLSVSLNRIITTSNDFSRERALRSTIESFITETKRKPVRDMTGEYFDEVLDVTMRAEVESLDVANADGDSLDDLYVLKIVVEYEWNGEPQLEETEVYVYQPERR